MSAGEKSAEPATGAVCLTSFFQATPAEPFLIKPQVFEKRKQVMQISQLTYEPFSSRFSKCYEYKSARDKSTNGPDR